jgi:hypothetical protein
MKHRIFVTFVVIALLAVTFGAVAPAGATNNCVFSIKGTKMRLTGNCTTDSTIFVPNGFFLDGKGFTITAVDPPGGHFLGAVIQNAGTSVEIRNVKINAGGLANVCDSNLPTDTRLRGILVNGANAIIRRNTILALNQGASGCQEGNGIEVRNAPFDGTHPNTVTADIGHNAVFNYQKTGILVNGDVNADVANNNVGASATQANLAANGIQLGFGAFGLVRNNVVAGNSWPGDEDTVATAILLFDTGGFIYVKNNNLTGNADIGIYIGGDGIKVRGNKVRESGPDNNQHGYDIGIGDYGVGSDISHNTVSGYDTPYDPPSAGARFAARRSIHVQPTTP